MTNQELEALKTSLVKQYEELRDRTNQVLGVIMWINQQLAQNTKTDNA